MSDIRYTISEMARMTDTEPHVLRYWEEELELFVPRNEMGHRYYTEKNLQNFKKIKELKRQGFQLRTIREIMRIEEEELKTAATGEDTEVPASCEADKNEEKPENKGWKAVSPKVVSVQSKQGKAAPQSRKMTQQNQHTAQQSRKAVQQKQKDSLQNQKPAGSADKAVQEEQFVQIMERLIHEIALHERKEGRYRRLDAAIRKHQQSRKMVAATQETGNEKGRQRKKKKQKR